MEVNLLKKVCYKKGVAEKEILLISWQLIITAIFF